MYATINPNTFREIAKNVWMLMTEFDPENFDGTIDGTKILGSSTGGITFADAPEYSDLGEDIDNCPKNTLELQWKEDGEVSLSGTFVTINASLVQMLIGSADVDINNSNHIIPRTSLKTSDFKPYIWAVTDYGENKVMAIKLKRVLNTSGFAAATTDNGKATFAFTFKSHKTLANLSDAPYEVYIAEDSSAVQYTYTAVTPEGTENPVNEGWYEKIGEDYYLTSDTTVDNEKTYYERVEA